MNIKELIFNIIVLKMPFSEKMKHLLIICKFGVKRIYNSKLNKDFFTISKLKIKTKSINNLLSLYYEIFVLEPYYFSINKKNPHIIDAGTNIGFALMYFKTNYPESKILAFEPVYSTYLIAQKNILLNKFKNIKLINSGISNLNAETFIHASENDKSSTLSSRLEDADVPGKMTWAEKCQIEKLSKYINGSIDFLKLDIEGAESSVIKELDESDKLIFIDRIFIEYHHNKSDLSQNNLSILTNLLRKNGFNYFINESVISTQKKTIRSFRFSDKHFALNIFAVKANLSVLDETRNENIKTRKKIKFNLQFMINKKIPIELYWEICKFSFRSWYVFKSHILLFTGYRSSSDKILTRFVKFRTNNYRKFEKIASVALKLKAYKYAVFILSILIEANPIRLDLINYKINALIKTGERKKALEIYNNIILNPPTNFDDYQNALFLKSLEEFEKEIKLLKSALQKLPQRVRIEKEIIDSHYRYGCNLKNRGTYSKAIKHLNKIKQKHRHYYNARYLIADSVAQIGRKLDSDRDYIGSKRKYEKSLFLFKEVLKNCPDRIDVRLSIIDVLKYLKRIDEAFIEINLLKEKYPNHDNIISKFMQINELRNMNTQ